MRLHIIIIHQEIVAIFDIVDFRLAEQTVHENRRSRRTLHFIHQYLP